MSRPIRPSVRLRVFFRDRYTCQYCGATAPDVKLAVDHIIPVARGGSDDEHNLTTACVPCNSGKHAQRIVPLARLLEDEHFEHEWAHAEAAMALPVLELPGDAWPMPVGIEDEPVADPRDVAWLNKHCGAAVGVSL